MPAYDSFGLDDDDRILAEIMLELERVGSTSVDPDNWIERHPHSRREANIAAEAALDGLYVIRTSVSAETMTPEETVGA